MSFRDRFSLCSLAAAALILLNGCLPSDSGQMDEEKEPHYELGVSREKALDYEGAKEAFNESLEANPRSAAAHFRLACIFDTSNDQLSDPAAAIYHYREYLRLKPKADNASLVQQRIEACKVQLASNVVSLPSAPAAQRQLEILVEKNRQLQEQVDKLTELNRQWSAYCASLKNNQASIQSPTGLVPAGNPMPADTTSASGGTPNYTPQPAQPQRSANPPPARPRTHTIAAGETLASIARKSGVSLATLQAANPGINPRKMRVGQTINLP